MTSQRVRTRLLLLGAVALALFLGAKINQFLTNPPLADLSEIKFRFSRKEESAMPVVEVFFVTNRRPVAGRNGEFENGSGESLSYGIAQIRMPAQLRVGDIQMPDIPRKIIDNQHAVILDVSVLTPEKFRAELSNRLAALKSRTFDLFIHGINHSFDSALRQAGTLSFDLDMPQPMVVLAWPTTPGILPGNYQTDRDQVTSASRQLANFLEAFQQDVHPEYMNVIAHSLGCKVACQTFDLIVREPAWQNDETKLSNIVLAAPDVSREDFDKTFVDDMAQIARRVTVYVSRNDGILALSSYLNGEPRAGEFDEDVFKLKELVVGDSSEAPHIQIIDATFVNNFLTAHSAFYQSRPAFHDLQNLLRLDLSADERHLLKHEKAGQANYWILRP